MQNEPHNNYFQNLKVFWSKNFEQASKLQWLWRWLALRLLTFTLWKFRIILSCSLGFVVFSVKLRYLELFLPKWVKNVVWCWGRWEFLFGPCRSQTRIRFQSSWEPRLERWSESASKEDREVFGHCSLTGEGCFRCSLAQPWKKV